MLSNNVANATITSVSTIATPISSEEMSYWTSISRYDEEYEKNEARRNIQLLSSAYTDKIEKT